MEGAQALRLNNEILAVLPEPVALSRPLYQLLLPLLNHGRFLLLLLVRFRMLPLKCFRFRLVAAFQM